MEAANRGAREAGGRSVACTITLPWEENTNPYVDQAVLFRRELPDRPPRSRLLGPDGLVPRLPGSRRPDGRLYVVALLRTDSAADAVDHICHTAPGSRGVAERNVPQWPAGASR